MAHSQRAPGRPANLRRRLLAASLHSVSNEVRELADQATLISELLESEPEAGEAFARVAARSVPRWHFAMLNDTERNAALVAALERILPCGATVLDIGSGSGLLAMAAIRAGARRVISCEMNPLLAEIARQNADRHGMSDVITVISKPSHLLEVGRDLPAPADVLVSEIVDCGLIGEGLLPSIRHARRHLLASDGLMMPSAARLYGQLLHSEAVLALNRVDKASEFDVSLMNTVATSGHFPVRLNTWLHRMMSRPAQLMDFDLSRGPLDPDTRLVTFEVTADGEAHGLVAWFELDLGGGITLSNAPQNTASHWMQAVALFDTPVPVKAGENVSIHLRWSDYRLSIDQALSIDASTRKDAGHEPRSRTQAVQPPWS
jgi:arginine Nomega-methyltransferase